MNSCDEFIENLRKTLPDTCTPKDLVRVGLYRSEQAAAFSRRNNTGPDHFKLPNRAVFYPKKGIIDFLEHRKKPYMKPKA